MRLPEHLTPPAAVTLAAGLLLAACAHEFLWQAFPAAQQGDVRMITQWPLSAAQLGALAWLARHRLVAATCAAAAGMCSTTALCSLAWLLHPWAVQPGQDQCSVRWRMPMMLVSAFMAALVLACWPRTAGRHNRRHHHG